jgi:hypothetical protein
LKYKYLVCLIENKEAIDCRRRVAVLREEYAREKGIFVVKYKVLDMPY